MACKDCKNCKYFECDECDEFNYSDIKINSRIINILLFFIKNIKDKFKLYYKSKFSKRNLIYKYYKLKWRNKRKWCYECLKYVKFITEIGHSYYGEIELNFWCKDERKQNKDKGIYTHWLSYTKKSKDGKFTYLQKEGKCVECNELTNIHKSNDPMCLKCQKKFNEERKGSHNCFKHDYDGGVCLICGSTTHRDIFD